MISDEEHVVLECPNTMCRQGHPNILCKEKSNCDDQEAISTVVFFGR